MDIEKEIRELVENIKIVGKIKIDNLKKKSRKRGRTSAKEKIDFSKIFSISFEINHPILKAAINIGNRSQSIKNNFLRKHPELFDINEYLDEDEIRNLEQLIKDDSKLKKKDKEANKKLKELEKKLEIKFNNKLKEYEKEAKDILVNDLIKAWKEELKTKRVLILVDFTGVAYEEWPNAFFGESDRVSETDLVNFIRIIKNSVPIYDKFAIWFSEEEANRMLKNLISKQIGEKLEGRKKISVEYAYIHLALLLIDIAENHPSLLKMIEKSSYGYIWAIVGGDRRLYFIPKLDLFIKTWIENDEKRDQLRKSINKFIEMVRKLRGDKFENIRKMLYKNYNDLMYILIERNMIDFEIVRNIVNNVIGISDILKEINYYPNLKEALLVAFT